LGYRIRQHRTGRSPKSHHVQSLFGQPGDLVFRTRESPVAIHVRQLTALRTGPKMADFCYIPGSAAVLLSETTAWKGVRMAQTNTGNGNLPPLTIVQPGEREVTGDLGGIGVAFKLWGRDTNGMVSVIEHPIAVGAFVEPHLHTREDEYSIVTDGEIGFRSGSREVVLGPGGYITKPRGEMHAMWNAGSVPARMIEIISPAGLENFFWEVSELLRAAAPPDLTQIVALAEGYGVQFGEPDWLPEIIDRYKLDASS